MKKIALLSIALLLLFFTACEPEEPTFDETLLFGKWKSGTVYYKYNGDKTGSTWDTADDVTEEEGQKFTWTLVNDDFTHIHIIEMGGTVPKYYTLTELTSTTLIYKDNFEKTFSFTKVSN